MQLGRKTYLAAFTMLAALGLVVSYILTEITFDVLPRRLYLHQVVESRTDEAGGHVVNSRENTGYIPINNSINIPIRSSKHDHYQRISDYLRKNFKVNSDYKLQNRSEAVRSNPSVNATPIKHNVSATPITSIVSATQSKSNVSATPITSIVSATQRKSNVSATPITSIDNATESKSNVSATPITSIVSATPRKINVSATPITSIANATESKPNVSATAITSIVSTTASKPNVSAAQSEPNISVFIETGNMTSATALAMKEETSHPYPQDVKIILHDPAICADNRLLYIIYVHSSPENVQKRNNLRRTWGNKKLFKDGRTNIVFLMGIPPDNQSQSIILREFVVYHDIVQGDFIDTYTSLTLKAIMGLKWVSKYCGNAQFAIKVDDDAFVNIFEAIKILSNDKQRQKSLACYQNRIMPILRNPATCMKWCVNADEFPGKKYYPRYCMGLFYIMSRDLVPALYNASRSTPFFWVDDVYITGLLTRKVKDVQYTHVPTFLKPEVNILNDYLNRTQPIGYIASHVPLEGFVLKIWAALLQRLTPVETELLSDGILAHNLSETATQ